MCGLETSTKRLPRLELRCSAAGKKELILRSTFLLENPVLDMMVYKIFDIRERNIARTTE
jgi:hypothetical protein